MAMNRPDGEPDPERQESAVAHGEKDEAELPDAEHTPRVTSNDWILGYVQEGPLRCVPLGSVFDEEGVGRFDPIPLPIDTENFIADELFDFLKKIERQGKGLHALDALAAKTTVGGNVVGAPRPPKRKSRRTSSIKQPLQEHNFDAGSPPTPEAHVVSPQEDQLALFLRSIEERYVVLRGGQRSRWERPGSVHFATKSTRPGSTDREVPAADSCEESTASVGGSSSTPLSASSRSQGEGAAPSPLTLAACGGKSGRAGAGGEEEERVYCEPTEADVLLGRGGLTNHHAGNKRYRHEIDQLKPWYLSCQTKSEKKELSALFLEYIHGYGGRFLEREEDTGRWYVANYRRARKKASQALRENKKQRREEQEGDGGTPRPASGS